MKRGGIGAVWGKVTVTAGVFWDAGQDVDSLVHFPSAFMRSTIACLRFLSSSLPGTAFLFFFFKLLRCRAQVKLGANWSFA